MTTAVAENTDAAPGLDPGAIHRLCRAEGDPRIKSAGGGCGWEGWGIPDMGLLLRRWLHLVLPLSPALPPDLIRGSLAACAVGRMTRGSSPREAFVGEEGRAGTT